jgi:hypothetical protein
LLWERFVSWRLVLCSFSAGLVATSRLTGLDYRALSEHGMRDMPASVIRGNQWFG